MQACAFDGVVAALGSRSGSVGPVAPADVDQTAAQADDAAAAGPQHGPVVVDSADEVTDLEGPAEAIGEIATGSGHRTHPSRLAFALTFFSISARTCSTVLSCLAAIAVTMLSQAARWESLGSWLS